MVAEAVYALCALTSIGCALLLLRGYRAARSKLLFWACLCFICLAASNVVLFVDLVLVPHIDLLPVRAVLALAGMMLLIIGMVWD